MRDLFSNWAVKPGGRLGCLACLVLAGTGALAAPDQPGPAATKKMAVKPGADRDMQELLKAYASLNGRPIEGLAPPLARRQPSMAQAVDLVLRQQGKSTDPEELVPGVKSADLTIPGAVGPLAARVYTPRGAGPFPVIVYFHGGGWVLADKQVYDSGARGLADQARAVVVSVDYRRAPENRFPAAWSDALAAYQWTASNASSLNGDPKKLALAGESAGGTLAVATAIEARDAGMAPLHVLAVYPITQTKLNTPSYQEYAYAKPLNRAMVQWFFNRTINSPADLREPHISLVDARLRGLPSVTIINAGIDPLRSDGARLEAALKKAGVAVERREYEGVTHEFFGAAAVLQKARDAQAYAGQRLQQAFGAAVAMPVEIK